MKLFLLFFFLLLSSQGSSKGEPICSDIECCKVKCEEGGYCCNYDLHTSSNQFFSCLDGCAMRIMGKSKRSVQHLCSERSCDYQDHTVGTIEKCSSCSDSTETGNCIFGVRDSGACMYGSSLADEPTVDTSQAKMSYPDSWFWDMGLEFSTSTGGNTWYTGVFNIQAEGYPLDSMQFGMAGTWQIPSGIDFDVCACNPHGEFGSCCSFKCEPYFQTIEGGPGYWGGELSTTQSKWRIGGAIGCYNYYLGSPMTYYDPGYVPGRDPLSCDLMAFIQTSNQIVVPPDGFTMEKGGLLGTGWVKTGMGKINESDTRNSWTLVMDSDTFSGPIGYVLPDAWQARDIDWESKTAHLQDFSNAPEITQQGVSFEWNSYYSYKTNSAYRIPRQVIPMTNGRGYLASSPTQYPESDTYDTVEIVLNSGVNNDQNILSNGTSEVCNPKIEEARVEVSLDYGVTIGSLHSEVVENQCVWSISVTSNSSCTNISGDCIVPQYYSAFSGMPMEASEAPPQLQRAKFPEKTETKSYDALQHANAGGCRDHPGPASSDLYCVETTSPSWIAYRWYRFVDQPPIQRAGLSDSEKNFLQNRIENLHRGTTRHSQWIKTPPFVTNAGRAGIDTAILTTPPKGMEVGFVPIALYEGKKKPHHCSHVF